MNYINDDLDNPKYIFHGSKELIESNIEPRQAASLNGIEDQCLNAIYGTPIYEKAVMFAIPKKTIEGMYGHWKCSKDNGTLYNMVIKEDAFGYVYVFDAKDFNPIESDEYQYVSLKKIIAN